MNSIAPSLSEADLREALCTGCQRLSQLGLNSGSAGNISCRFEGGVLISPTGADSDTTPTAMVAITLDGDTRSAGIPSSEWSMHTEIYRRYPQAQAIVHTHSDACVALSCQRQAIPAFHYMLASFGGDDIPCADYATFGTDALASAAADALKARNACLLANHGMICHAATVQKAVANAAKLETLARQYWMSVQLGPPVLLSTQEMTLVRERYKSYGKARMDTRSS
jgi:L-fuculose-phosphate aldolase